MAALALGYGLMAYASFRMDEAVTDVARWISGRPGIPVVHNWDEKFFAALCGIATLGAIGMFLRRRWARIISFLGFGASGVWALMISFAPESWRGVWFSTWVDRWVAALVTVLSIGGLGWLFSRQAREEFQRLGQLHGH